MKKPAKRSSHSITLLLITSSFFLAACDDHSALDTPQGPQPQVSPEADNGGIVQVEPDGAATQPGTMPATRTASRSSGTTARRITTITPSPSYSHTTTPFSLGGSLFSGSRTSSSSISSSHISSSSGSSSFSSSHSISTVHGGFGSSAVSHASASHASSGS